MSMKPILFSTPMVQAILDGRKTMTRRVIKTDDSPDNWQISLAGTSIVRTKPYDAILSRYKVGDILWVRETWVEMHGAYFYRADIDESVKALMEPHGAVWKPSIFMPREAARIFLRVTDVRVERLQDILCGDMKREGCIPDTVTGGQYQQWQRDYWIPLWDSINAKRGYGWYTNPWVWVYTFERVEKPDSTRTVAESATHGEFIPDKEVEG